MPRSKRAFTLFTDRFGDIKPREHNLLATPIAETVFEPRVGGHIYDRAVDGTECHWARILAFEPPHRVVFSWDIGPRWELESDPENASEVEVRYSAPTARNARGSSSNTAISTGMAPDGRPSRTGWPTMPAGCST